MLYYFFCSTLIYSPRVVLSNTFLLLLQYILFLQYSFFVLDCITCKMGISRGESAERKGRHDSSSDEDRAPVWDAILVIFSFNF